MTTPVGCGRKKRRCRQGFSRQRCVWLQKGIKTIHYKQIKMSLRGLQAAMRMRWDEAKRQEVLQRRQIDFAVLHEVLSLPYVEDQRSDDPGQYRVIGFGQGRLVTFIVEYRQDAIGEYR